MPRRVPHPSLLSSEGWIYRQLLPLSVLAVILSGVWFYRVPHSCAFVAHGWGRCPSGGSRGLQPPETIPAKKRASAPGLVLAFASEIGPGFSLGIQLHRIGGFNPREHALAGCPVLSRICERVGFRVPHLRRGLIAVKVGSLPLSVFAVILSAAKNPCIYLCF